jgi:hypothetical protein
MTLKRKEGSRKGRGVWSIWFVLGNKLSLYKLGAGDFVLTD